MLDDARGDPTPEVSTLSMTELRPRLPEAIDRANNFFERMPLQSIMANASFLDESGAASGKSFGSRG